MCEFVEVVMCFFFFLIIKPILVVRGLYVSVALRHF